MGGGDVVDGVGAAVIGLEVLGGVAHRDGPEAVHPPRRVRSAGIPSGNPGVDVEIGSFMVGQLPVPGGGTDQVPHRVDLTFGAEGALEAHGPA